MKQPNNQALYLLKRSPYGNGGQLVLHVTDKFKEGYVCFDDTNRGHKVEGQIVETKTNSFIFNDNNSREWEFEEVTIEMFREGLFRFACNGEEIAELCKTTEDLWEYYRKQFPL